MGSPESEKDRGDEEQHRVVISKGFYMGVGPVTRGQFARFVAEANYKTEAETANEKKVWYSPGFTQTDEHPVVFVSWNDALAFCAWATRPCQHEVRLPTEAEWEYACRAGTTTPFYFGSQLNGTQANCDGTFPYGMSAKGPNLKETTPVGKYMDKCPHPWGLCDVHGNVFEWCSDWFERDYYKRSPTTDPRCEDSEEKYPVVRGGAWNVDGAFCRAAFRGGFEQTSRAGILGYRVLFAAP